MKSAPKYGHLLATLASYKVTNYAKRGGMFYILMSGDRLCQSFLKKKSHFFSTFSGLDAFFSMHVYDYTVDFQPVFLLEHSQVPDDLSDKYQ